MDQDRILGPCPKCRDAGRKNEEGDDQPPQDHPRQEVGQALRRLRGLPRLRPDLRHPAARRPDQARGDLLDLRRDAAAQGVDRPPAVEPVPERGMPLDGGDAQGQRAEREAARAAKEAAAAAAAAATAPMAPPPRGRARTPRSRPRRRRRSDRRAPARTGNGARTAAARRPGAQLSFAIRARAKREALAVEPPGWDLMGIAGQRSAVDTTARRPGRAGCRIGCLELSEISELIADLGLEECRRRSDSSSSSSVGDRGQRRLRPRGAGAGHLRERHPRHQDDRRARSVLRRGAALPACSPHREEVDLAKRIEDGRRPGARSA